MKKTYEAAFWERVNKDGPIPTYRPDLGNCWLWTGASSIHGNGRYGTFRGTYAHRASMLLAGHEPTALHVDHLCRVTLCVRPTHLEFVTSGENLKRGYEARGLKTHCKHGHEFTVSNTYYAKNGGRICKTCVLDRVAVMKAYRKANALCQDCGQPTGGKAFCPTHRAIRVKREQKRLSQLQLVSDVDMEEME